MDPLPCSGTPAVVQRSATEFTQANLSDAYRTLLKEALAKCVCLDNQPLSALEVFLEKPDVTHVMGSTFSTLGSTF
jgi:hypothetical protein